MAPAAVANSNLPPAMPRTATLWPALSSTFAGAANGFRIVQVSPRSERTTTPPTTPAASTVALTRNAPTARSVLNDAASPSGQPGADHDLRLAQQGADLADHGTLNLGGRHPPHNAVVAGCVALQHALGDVVAVEPAVLHAVRRR